LTGWNNVHWVEWNWEFFPEAAIHRFLVRAYAHGEVRDGACWRTGAVLKRHGAKVAVLSEPDAGQVKVLIQKSTDEATTPSRAELEFVDQFVLPRLMDIIGREPDPEKTKQSWESGPKDSEDPATSKTDFKGKRINERMLDILLKKRESLWWTAENWRIALK